MRGGVIQVPDAESSVIRVPSGVFWVPTRTYGWCHSSTRLVSSEYRTSRNGVF